MLKAGKAGNYDIYIIGCGPSLKKFNWSYLKDKTTIAVNGSIRDVPNPDYFITGDSSYIIKAAQNDFWGIKTNTVVVISNGHKNIFKVKPHLLKYDHRIVPRAYDGNIGISESEFCTGCNSGFCAIQLAVILDAKKIHLLGIDLSIEGGEHYKKPYGKLDVGRLDEFYNYFVTASSILKRREIELISHSPISRLNNVITYQKLENV